MSSFCPIPRPVGQINGSFFGNHPPVPLPDFTLADFTGNNLLDGQIVVQLANTRCLSGLTFTQLLGRLQSNYPNQNWTSQLLNERLTQGIRRGRVCLSAANTYVLKKNMVQLNYNNQKFQNLADQIIKEPICQTTVTSNYIGTYEGNLPICGNNTCGRPAILGLLPPAARQAFINQINQNQDP